MNYTIAEMRELHSDINFRITYEADGNKYIVGLSWKDSDGGHYRHVRLEQEEALKRFNALSNVILTGCFSLLDRIAILEGNK